MPDHAQDDIGGACKPAALLPDQPEEAHFRICYKAEAKLSAMCDGNGLTGRQVKLQRHEALVHQLPGELAIVLKPDIVHTEHAGARPDGIVVGTQQEAISKAETLGQEFLKSKDVVDELEAGLKLYRTGGWGESPFQVYLKNTTKKTFSVVEKCQKCMGNKKRPCGQCGATGFSPCGNCGGQGTMPCALCYGTGRINNPADGSQTPCQSCIGTGRKMCIPCNGQKRIPCSVCRGEKATLCVDCGGTGSWTHAYSVTYHADATFTLSRELIPEDVMAIADHLGGKYGVKTLSDADHAEIFRLPLLIEEKKTHYPMVAFLPVTKGEMAIAGKTQEFVAAGLQATFTELPALLDPYIKPGISALLKLSKGPMAAEALLRTALKYRLLRATISGLMHHSKGAVFKKLQHDYPLVVSEKFKRAAVKYAADALLALGEGPRNKGLLFGLAGAGALSFSYYLSPARAMLRQAMAQQGIGQHILAGDILVWVAGYLCALFTVKKFASRALHALLPDDEAGKSGLPDAGKQGIHALLGSFALWAAAAFAAPVKPEWVAQILKMAGIQ